MAAALFRLRELLLRPRAQPFIALLALLLVSPALLSGLVIDDHVLRLLARAETSLPGFDGDPLQLFRFTSGRVEDNRALMDTGALLPWWSDPQHLNAFFRPLASLSHALDFALYPDSALLMHLHSLAWFLALLLVVAHVYLRLFGALDPTGSEPASGATAARDRARFVALLAFALFAFDDAHGMTVAWIANRNALIAATLALPALGAHHRWLALGWRKGALLGPLCFALGLCAGETAVAVFGYLIAYTLVLDRARLPRRLLHIAPYLALLLAWRATFGLLGLGSFGSDAYHDPGREPLAYARSLLEHLPVLLGAQLGMPLADLWFWGSPALRWPIWAVCAASAAAVLALGHLLLARDQVARFFTMGMVLSACALAASVPGERLLLVPGVGAAALVATLLEALPAAARPGLGARHLAFLALFGWHLVAAPLLLPLRSLQMVLLARTADRIDQSLPSTPDIRERTVIVLNAPVDLLVSYVQVARAVRGAPRPAHLYWLATASSPLRVERVDDHSLRVVPERGFLWSAPERHYRSNVRALGTGATVALSQMTAQVESQTADGRPAAVRFRFREALDSPRYLFMRFEQGRLVETAPPPLGKPLHFAHEELLQAILARPPEQRAGGP